MLGDGGDVGELGRVVNQHSKQKVHALHVAALRVVSAEVKEGLSEESESVCLGGWVAEGWMGGEGARKVLFHLAHHFLPLLTINCVLVGRTRSTLIVSSHERFPPIDPETPRDTLAPMLPSVGDRTNNISKDTMPDLLLQIEPIPLPIFMLDTGIGF